MTDFKRPQRWSYSALSTYKACPAQYKYSYIDNLPSPASPAMARGTRLHTLCEGYVLGTLPHLPNDLRKIGAMLEGLRLLKAKAEEVWLHDKAWRPCDDANSWIKAIVDVHYLQGDVLHVIDYKSGQAYPEHDEQLQFYGILGLEQVPEAKRVEYRAIYIDSGSTGAVGGLIRPMADGLRDRWEADAQTMYSDVEFVPTPGKGCRWCSYHKKNNGPCTSGI